MKNDDIILTTSKILYRTRRVNIKIYLKYINKDFLIIILIDVLYTTININLLSTL